MVHSVLKTLLLLLLLLLLLSLLLLITIIIIIIIIIIITIIYSGRTKPKWSVPFNVPTEIFGIWGWMESTPGVKIEPDFRHLPRKHERQHKRKYIIFVLFEGVLP